MGPKPNTDRSRLLGLLLLLALSRAFACFAAAVPSSPPPVVDQVTRNRLEQFLLQNPFQERVFDQLFQSYQGLEGVDRWIESLTGRADGTNAGTVEVLLGRVFERQGNLTNAVRHLELATEKGESRVESKVLLGTLLYRSGRDDQAAPLLVAGLDALTDSDRRASVTKLLGNLFLRQGKRDEALKTWQRLGERNDPIALTELAGIYEENRLWDEAIGVYRRIVAGSAQDPYRMCLALRSLGQCLVEQGKPKEAIAIFEQALGLTSPGNWLFDDLKNRLATVYEGLGDLAGLAKYLEARVAQTPNETTLLDFLAEIHLRLGKLDAAEAAFRKVLERDQRNTAVFEKLLLLLSRQGKSDAVIATYEKLIEAFPNDTEYVKRLGDEYFKRSENKKAEETWRRVVKDPRNAERWALLAGWYAEHDLVGEAIASYEAALRASTTGGAESNRKERIFRLSDLKFRAGDELAAVGLLLSTTTPQSGIAELNEVADALESHRKHREAEPLRRAAVEKDPRSAENRIALALNLTDQRRFQDALATYATLTDTTVAGGEAAQRQALDGLIDVYAKQGTLQWREAKWQREVARTPNSIDAIRRLAALYSRVGQAEKEIPLQRRLFELQPGNLEVLRSLAAASRKAGQLEDSIAAYKQLLEADKGRARTYLEALLELYLDAGSMAEATGAIRQIEALSPPDVETRMRLGQLLILHKATELAVEQFREAVTLRPNEPENQRKYGVALTSLERFAEARTAFRKMFENSKTPEGRIEAVTNLATVYLKEGALAELESEFLQRTKATPEKLAAYRELAAIYRTSGAYTKAMDLLDQALSALDDKITALRDLIGWSQEVEDLNREKSYYEKLMPLLGKPTLDDFEHLGGIYALLGEPDKARVTWNKMLERSPDAATMRRVELLLRDEAFLRGEMLVAKAKEVAQSPRDLKLRYEYAMMLQSVTQISNSLVQLQKVLEIGDQEAPRRGGRRAAAIDDFDRKTQNPFVRLIAPKAATVLDPSWTNQTFAEFRPLIVLAMAKAAATFGSFDQLVQTFTARIAQEPARESPKRDLLLLELSAQHWDESRALANQILQSTPDDLDLVEFLTHYYSSMRPDTRAVVPLVEQLTKADPLRLVPAAESLLPLFLKNGEATRGVELAHLMVDRSQNPAPLTSYLGGVMLLQGRSDLSIALYERDPTFRTEHASLMASTYIMAGKRDQAIDLFRRTIFEEPKNTPGGQGTAAFELYLPQRITPELVIGLVAGTTVPFSIPDLPLEVIGPSLSSKSYALRRILQLLRGEPDGFQIVDEIEAAARQYSSQQSESEQRKAWESARVLFSYYFCRTEYDRVTKLLEFYRAAEKEDIEWYNLAIYNEQRQEHYGKMLDYYEEILTRFPRKADEIGSLLKRYRNIFPPELNLAVTNAELDARITALTAKWSNPFKPYVRSR